MRIYIPPSTCSTGLCSEILIIAAFGRGFRSRSGSGSTYSSSTEIGALLVASLNMKRGFGCVSISLRHVHCSLYYVACTISKGTQRSVALPAKYSTISQRTST